MTPLELDALAYSARLAVITVALCFPLAVLAASWTGRRGPPGRWVIDAVLLLPMAVSPAAVGWVVWRLVGGQAGGPASGASAALVLAMATLVLPLMIRTMRPAFEVVDHQLVMAARTLGASRASAWWSITLAQTAPLLGSATALGLAAAWGESGAAMMLASGWSPAVGGLPDDLATVPVTLLDTVDAPARHGSAWRLCGVSLGVALAATLCSEWLRQRWRRHALPRQARGVSA